MFKKSLLALLFLFSFTACVQESPQRKAPDDMGAIKTVTLEVRAEGPGQPDNWKNAALFLTEYDRKQNYTSLYITTNQRVTQSPKTIIAENCTAGAECGLTKAGAGMSLENIDLDHAESQMQLLGVKSHFEMPNDGDFNQGDVWIVNAIQQECNGCTTWETTVAVELTDFKSVTDQVTLRYKILEYRKVDNISPFHD